MVHFLLGSILLLVDILHRSPLIIVLFLPTLLEVL